MNPPGKVERQSVYLAYRELFSGKNALVRNKKVILSIIRATPTIEPLVGKHLKHKTIPILKSLLNDRVFEQEEQARKEFPELWLKSSEDRQPSKTRTQHSTPHKELVKHEDSGMKFNAQSLPHANPHGSHVIDGKGGVSLPLDVLPLKFSYDSQHHVLASIQQNLEATCFNFTKTWLPCVLKEHGWSCAAAVELTRWLRIMGKRLDRLPEDCMDEAGRAEFKKISPCLAKLRHSAVHRLHLQSDDILELFRAALMLMNLLHDNRSASKLKVVHDRLEDNIKKTKHDTKAMEQEVNDAFMAIEKQREALDWREQQLQNTAAAELSRISEAANHSLLGCIDGLLEIRRPENMGEKGIQLNKHTSSSSGDVDVDEDDIESDEDQLQASLG